MIEEIVTCTDCVLVLKRNSLVLFLFTFVLSLISIKWEWMSKLHTWWN